MIDHHQEQYRTSNLHEAAYLWCRGLEPRLEAVDVDRVYFLFDESRVRPQIDDYIRGDALVEPLRFSAAVRELKRRASGLTR